MRKDFNFSKFSIPTYENNIKAVKRDWFQKFKPLELLTKTLLIQTRFV